MSSPRRFAGALSRPWRLSLLWCARTHFSLLFLQRSAASPLRLQCARAAKISRSVIGTKGRWGISVRLSPSALASEGYPHAFREIHSIPLRAVALAFPARAREVMCLRDGDLLTGHLVRFGCCLLAS